MTRKKSAAQLAMRFLVCLALLAPCAGQAGADSISIYSWTGWRQSTQVNYDDAVPWGGVSSLPAPETFTLPTEAYTYPYVQSVGWGATTLYAGPGVRYFRALFDMPDFAVLAADVAASVDNDIEIYINRHLLVREGSFAVENFSAPHLGVSQGYEQVVNGSFGTQMFDWAAPTFPRTNWIRGGVNEVILVVRNLSGSDNGGFSFVMNISTTPNNPPVANSDVVTTNEDTPVSLQVTANDTEPDGQSVTVTAVTQGAKGSVALQAGGMVTYTPNPNLNGQDTFTYTLSDGIKTATGTVTVTVNPVNDPPVAVADTAFVVYQGTVTKDVVANDRDIDGDALTVTAVTQPAFGTAAIVDNKVKYTNTRGTYSPFRDSLIYTVSDGYGGSATAFLKLTISGRFPALSVPQSQPLTVKAGLPLRFTVKAHDPNYRPPAALPVLVQLATKPKGSLLRNDTLSWTPLFDQPGTYKVVFGARTNTSPSLLTTKAVAITVQPNRYPNLIVGGVPRKAPVPVYGYVPVYRWFYYNGRPVFQYIVRYQYQQTGTTYRVAQGEKTGFEIRKKNPTTISTRFAGFSSANGLVTDWNLPDGAYRQNIGITRPAVGNLDGVGLSEVAVGAGTGSGGQVTIWQPSTGASKGVITGWPEYNAANGETWPAMGDVNGDKRAELFVGFGKGGLGYLQGYVAWSWLSLAGWLQVPDVNNYNQTNGTTRPAMGDLTGDGRAEIVVGVDGYGANIPSRVWIFTWSGAWRAAPLTIPALAGLEDARYNCETWPAIGDLNGDGKNELVINVTKIVNGTRQPVGFGVWTSAVANGRLTFKLQAFKKAATFGLPALGDVFTPDGKKEIVLSQGDGSKALSVFNAAITNGRWSIAPVGTITTGHNNPYPVFGKVVP